MLTVAASMRLWSGDSTALPARCLVPRLGHRVRFAFGTDTHFDANGKDGVHRPRRRRRARAEPHRRTGEGRPPECPGQGETAREATEGRGRHQDYHSSRKGAPGGRSYRKKGISKGTAQRALCGCPKTHELFGPTFLIRIASFQDGYLMSGGVCVA